MNHVDWRKEWDDLFHKIQDPLSDISARILSFKEAYGVRPDPKDVFNMFKMIHPDNVRIVMIGQSPYPGVCSYTGIPYACGPAFLPHPGCITTPVTLRQIGTELCRDMQISQLPMPLPNLLKSWIEQGVMFLNASMTIGFNCPKYLEDHSVVWEEIMRVIVHTLAESLVHTPVFVLIGRDAWKFEDCCSSNIVIKVSHPAARAYVTKGVPWIGSGVFSAVSSALEDIGEVPMSWV